MKTVSYLLLGDGDFTYSLDLCRFIASLSHQTPNSAAESVVYSITCTGVDTLEELRSKYKDADFILRNIRQCSTNDVLRENECSIKLTARIFHGINAVQAEDYKNNGEDTQQRTSLQNFDHVMFHHPHLGKEDAQLHSRFLHHLFYAANKRWLKHKNDVSSGTRNNSSETSAGGIFYLTLVNGQCSRWKCIEAAKKHGLILIRRSPFNPPPAVTNSTTCYQLRRHQSGKSFAKRRRMQQQPGEHKQINSLNSLCENDSETLVFGRECEYEHLVSASIDGTSNDEQHHRFGLLPWENYNRSLIALINQRNNHDMNNNFLCLYCTKTFRQERSLKNHMLNTHPECKEVVSWAAKNRKKYKKSKVPVSCERNVANSANPEDNTQQHGLSIKVDNIEAPLICSMCEEMRPKDPSTNETARLFPHMQALLDHQRAKHFGSHSDIKPDWYNNCGTAAQTDKLGINEDSQIRSNLRSCFICGMPYSSDAERLQHELEFVPCPSLQSTSSDGHIDAISDTHKCKYCSKSFKGVRAQQQHENFCLTCPRNSVSMK